MFSHFKNNKKLSIAGKFLLGFNILAIVCLLLSYYSAYLSPAKNWLIAFFGLAYILIVAINFFFLLWWILRLRWFFLLSLIAILIGWNTLGKHIKLRFSSSKAPIEKSFKIMSFNVRNFDAYNYTKKWEYQTERRDKIFKLLSSESPDIICFQEFFYEKTGKFKTIDTMVQFMKAKNVHAEYTSSAKSVNFFGDATFSKYTIVNKGIVPYTTNSGNLCMFTDVLIGSDTVRIYNVHLESIRLGDEDYKFAEKVNKVSNINDDEKVKQHSRRILSRLKTAFIKRAPQAEVIAKHIKECHYPIILCGDFNDTPSSYSYHQVSAGLIDSFTESGSGIGNTYNGIFPSFRIDYIFHSYHFTSYEFETIRVELSDHYPVKCFLNRDK